MNKQALTTLQPLFVTFLAIMPSTAGADDILTEARKLYAAAFYERALTALEQIDPQQTVAPGDQQSVRRYKALCLIALDRADDAARVASDIVLAEPMATGDPADPPRLRDLIRQARLRVMPGVVRERYGRGRKHFLQKAFTEASADFESVVALVDDKSLGLASRPELADLRLLAQGFLDLSRNVASRVAPAPPPAPENQTDSVPTDNKGAAAGGLIPPVVIFQELPPVPQVMRQLLRQSGEGAIEVTVAADGSVESVALVRPSHFAYDSLLMAAAKTWKYRPALRAGVPVPYKKLIRVVFTN